MKKNICIAAPVYNEQENIHAFVQELLSVISSVSSNYHCMLLLVNDGSTDRTEEILKQLCEEHPKVLKVVNLSTNFGHQAACKACISFAEGDAMILMDSDLQDDPAAIPQFLEKWEQGCQVVYAVRVTRFEGFIARLLFNAFYRVFNLISRTKIPLDAGNYSLMDKRVYSRLQVSRDHNYYIPGERALVGFRQEGVPVPRRARPDQVSRVGYTGLFKLAKDAMFSFSRVPIRMFNVFGVFALLSAILLSLFVFLSRFFVDVVPAWSSQMITTIFFGGINLIGIGTIGEYVARIYDEVRDRKVFIVRDVIVNGREEPM